MSLPASSRFICESIDANVVEKSPTGSTQTPLSYFADIERRCSASQSYNASQRELLLQNIARQGNATVEEEDIFDFRWKDQGASEMESYASVMARLGIAAQYQDAE